MQPDFCVALLHMRDSDAYSNSMEHKHQWGILWNWTFGFWDLEEREQDDMWSLTYLPVTDMFILVD